MENIKGRGESCMRMGLFALSSALFIYAIMIGVIALVAYFVIKKAIKDALRERDQEKKL